jgi:hypothetical protein
MALLTSDETSDETESVVERLIELGFLESTSCLGCWLMPALHRALDELRRLRWVQNCRQGELARLKQETQR